MTVSSSPFRSRKFVVTLVLLAIGAWFEIQGDLSQNMLDLLRWIGGLYLGANVGQKGVELVKGKQGGQE